MRFRTNSKNKKKSGAMNAADIVRSLDPALKQQLLSYMSREEREELEKYAAGKDDNSDVLQGQFFEKDTVQNVMTVHKNLKSLLADADPEKIYLLIRNEHPQIRAYVVSCIKSSKASDVMQKFTKDTQKDIRMRTENLEEVSQEYKDIIFNYFKEKLNY